MPMCVSVRQMLGHEPEHMSSHVIKHAPGKHVLGTVLDAPEQTSQNLLANPPPRFIIESHLSACLPPLVHDITHGQPLSHLHCVN